MESDGKSGLTAAVPSPCTLFNAEWLISTWSYCVGRRRRCRGVVSSLCAFRFQRDMSLIFMHGGSSATGSCVDGFSTRVAAQKTHPAVFTKWALPIPRRSSPCKRKHTEHGCCRKRERQPGDASIP